MKQSFSARKPTYTTYSHVVQSCGAYILCQKECTHQSYIAHPSHQVISIQKPSIDLQGWDVHSLIHKCAQGLRLSIRRICLSKAKLTCHSVKKTRASGPPAGRLQLALNEGRHGPSRHRALDVAVWLTRRNVHVIIELGCGWVTGDEVKVGGVHEHAVSLRTWTPDARTQHGETAGTRSKLSRARTMVRYARQCGHAQMPTAQGMFLHDDCVICMFA